MGSVTLLYKPLFLEVSLIERGVGGGGQGLKELVQYDDEIS